MPSRDITLNIPNERIILKLCVHPHPQCPSLLPQNFQMDVLGKVICMLEEEYSFPFFKEGITGTFT